MTDAANESPLAGLKVLDFSRVLAGPYVGRLLRDLGADVVKIEPPDGDITRTWGRKIAGLSGFYTHANAGKRNICVDLRADGARELMLELVRHADIVLENYRPGVMDRLGLGYETLREVNPRIIMLSVSGFGHGGPESNRPAYAPIIHAESGLMNRADRRRGIGLQDLPTSISDTNAGLHGTIGVLAAVVLRDRTGVGQHIDVAMLDATMMTDDQLHYDLEDAEDTAPIPNDVWQTGTGPILVSADFRWLWKQLTGVIGLQSPSTEGLSLEEKIRCRRETVSDYFASLDSRAAIEDAMTRMNIAWGPVRHGRELTDQPTVKARGSIVDLDDRAGGTRPVLQSPWRFSSAQSGVRGPAPHRGEHNAQVLAEWLGADPGRVDALTAAGVLQHEDRDD